MKDRVWPWIFGCLVYSAIILITMFYAVGPALHMGSAAFHLVWPLIIIGLLFTVTRKPVADLWA